MGWAWVTGHASGVTARAYGCPHHRGGHKGRGRGRHRVVADMQGPGCGRAPGACMARQGCPALLPRLLQDLCDLLRCAGAWRS